MSAAVASQRGSGCCDGTPAAGNGTRTDRERSREQGGVRVAGGGGRRGPVCLRSKSLNSLCTQSHAASMSPLIPSPSRRAGISCAGDARATVFRTSFFFNRQTKDHSAAAAGPSSSLLFALRRFQRQLAPCRSVHSREPRPSLQPHTPCQRTTH